MRISEINRVTNETNVSVSLDIDGTGQSDISTGVGFLDHMLTLLSRHARFDLTIRCAGDTDVDDHHSVEDIGIALGAALGEAVGDKRGITRYGSIVLPMDEALVLCAADISGRAHLSYDMGALPEKIGSFDTELSRDFWEAFSQNAKITIHLRRFAGQNAHHIVEAAFKAAGRALRQALSIDLDLADEIPSTKGVL